MLRMDLEILNVTFAGNPSRKLKASGKVCMFLVVDRVSLRLGWYSTWICAPAPVIHIHPWWWGWPARWYFGSAIAPINVILIILLKAFPGVCIVITITVSSDIGITAGLGAGGACQAGSDQVPSAIVFPVFITGHCCPSTPCFGDNIAAG